MWSVRVDNERAVDADGTRRTRGRPTRAAAAERDERLLEIAGAMFLDHGFEATTMDRVAEAAGIGKATLYARYPDKAALFVDVLRRRIVEFYASLEEEFGRPFAGDLESALQRVAARLLDKSLSPGAVAIGRILAAQAPNFPELARLFVEEGLGRQVRLVAGLLGRYAGDPRYDLADLPLAADLFLSMAVGRASRLSSFGITPDPAELKRRTAAAARVFVRGISVA